MARTVPRSMLEVVHEPDGRLDPVASQPPADGGGLAAGTQGTQGTVARQGGRAGWRRGPPRWWLAAAAAIAVVTGALALPVRSTIAVNELHSLDRRWAWYEALDAERAHLVAELGAEANDANDPRVAQGSAALDAEEAPLLRAAGSTLIAGRHLPDTGLSRLRVVIAAAFADQADDLEREARSLLSLRSLRSVHSARSAGSAGSAGSALPAGGLGEDRTTTLAMLNVVHVLNAELARWRQQAAVRPVPVPRLVAADELLAQLAMPADEPIDARLIALGPAGTLTAVDLGMASGRRVVRRPALADRTATGPIVVRSGWVAVAGAVDVQTGPSTTNGPVYALSLSPDLAGDPRLIGSTVGGVVVPGADPNGVWLQDGGNTVEVNRAGATLQGPVAIGDNRTLVGATDDLLVTTSGLASSAPNSELQVVALPVRRLAPTRVLAANGQLVAAIAGHIAWLDRGADGTVALRLADGAAQHVRVVAPPALANAGPTPPSGLVPRGLPVDDGAFSPDGSTLALRVLTVSNGATDVQLSVIDVTTGAVRLIDGSIGDHPAGPIVWSPKGDRVFFIAATGSSANIWGWQVGAARPSAIRVSIDNLVDLTVAAR